MLCPASSRCSLNVAILISRGTNEAYVNTTLLHPPFTIYISWEQVWAELFNYKHMWFGLPKEPQIKNFFWQAIYSGLESAKYTRVPNSDETVEKSPVRDLLHGLSNRLDLRPTKEWRFLLSPPWASQQLALSPCPSPIILCAHGCTLLLSWSVVSDSLQPQGPQHSRLPYSSLAPGVCSNSCPLTQWCHPTILSSVALSVCPTVNSSEREENRLRILLCLLHVTFI